jgi:outer membrane protein OmpA-like peptidoglycan-associated protein
MHYKFTIIAISVAFALSGCANMSETQRGTGIGTGVGAATGAGIGAIAGGGKGAAIGALSGAAVGAAGGYLWSNRMEEQKRTMEQATAGSGVQVSQTADNQLKLDIPSDISFDIGSAEIKPSMRPVLDSFARSLNTNPGTGVTIIGHTDNTGSDAVNNPLSFNRAASARNYLVNRSVASNRINIDGRGSREPVFANNTAANRARNRRIEIFVAESQSAQPQSVQPVYPPQSVVERCNRYASQEVTGKTEEVVKDAGIGALGGAALGAAIGAISGGGSGAAKGAGIGAIAGGAGGGLYGLNENQKNDARYQEAYASCLRQNGF